MTYMKQAPNGSTNLPEREWNFADCPPDEIYDCWLYEFAREVGWLKAAVARRKGPITTKYGATVQVDTLPGLARETFYTFLLMPQWPEKPYLSVSMAERDRAHLRTKGRPSEFHQDIRADSLVPVEVPKGIEADLAACLQNAGGASLRRPRIRSKSNRMELALLQIDWALPDSVLKAAFEAYIKKFRPLCPNSVIRRTGKSDPDSMRLRQLEQLGRFRLLRANGQNVERARKTGYLSASHHCWYRAQRAVTVLLENAETQIIPLLSRVELENYRALNTPSKSE